MSNGRSSAAYQASTRLDSLEQKREATRNRATAIQLNSRLTTDAQAADSQQLWETFHAEAERESAELEALLSSERERIGDAETHVREQIICTPRELAEWQQADARAALVKEDLQQLAAQSPAEIASEFKSALRRDDTVRAYLIARYAPAALDQNNQTHARARQALDEAIAERATAFGPKTIKLAERRAELEELQGRLDDLRYGGALEDLVARKKASGVFL